MADTETKDAPEAEEASTEKKRINLEIKIDSPSACQRHVTIKIPHEDVERYFDDAFGELMPGATVGPRAAQARRASLQEGSERSGQKQLAHGQHGASERRTKARGDQRTGHRSDRGRSA
jgi:hypothetical protein